MVCVSLTSSQQRRLQCSRDSLDVPDLITRSPKICRTQGCSVGSERILMTPPNRLQSHNNLTHVSKLANFSVTLSPLNWDSDIGHCFPRRTVGRVSQQLSQPWFEGGSFSYLLFWWLMHPCCWWRRGLLIPRRTARGITKRKPRTITVTNIRTSGASISLYDTIHTGMRGPLGDHDGVVVRA